MSLILGMGIWVFLAWVLTILAAILCILYGIYHELIKKIPDDEPKTKDKPQKKQPTKAKKKGEK